MRILIYIFLLCLFGCKIKSNDSSSIEQKNTFQDIVGLSLPNGLNPIETRDEFLPNGDGVFLQRYAIDNKIYEEVRRQIPNKGKNLPFRDDEYIDNCIFEFISEHDKGVYIIRQLDDDDSRDILLVVLNRTKMELIILMSKS